LLYNPDVTPHGSFAEYLVADPGLLIHIPDDISFESAAQLAVSCFTACQALYQTFHLPTPLEPATEPMDILIWSGSSFTGQFAVQLAHLSGLRVISTSSPRNFDLIRSLGAAEVYDYADSRAARKIHAATGSKLKLALDCISSGTTPAQVSGCLSKEGGTIATTLPYTTPKKGVNTELVLLYSIWGKVCWELD